MLGFFLLCAGCLVDLDGDGVREVLFVGDSNTRFLGCAYPIQWQARHDPAVLRGYDEGIFGTTAHFWVDNAVLVDRLDRDHPDGVVIALGTNDVGQRIEPDRILWNLVTLYRQVLDHTFPNGAHPIAAIATVPPVYDPAGRDPAGTATMNAEIRALNALIRHWLPPSRVVDFDSWMPAEWDPAFMWTNGKGLPDGVHVGCAAHGIRADLIDDLIARVSLPQPTARRPQATRPPRRMIHRRARRLAPGPERMPFEDPAVGRSPDRRRRGG